MSNQKTFYLNFILLLITFIITSGCSISTKNLNSPMENNREIATHCNPSQFDKLKNQEQQRVDLGTPIEINGMVISIPGAFNSALDQGLAIQCGTGIGAWISLNKIMAEKYKNIKQGMMIRVKGTVSEINKMRSVSPLEINVIQNTSIKTELRPIPVTVQEALDIQDGVLVKIKGILSKSVIVDKTYGFKLYIKDETGEIQVFVHASIDDVDLNSLSRFVNNDKIEVVGIRGRYQKIDEIMPRSIQDIQLSHEFQ